MSSSDKVPSDQAACAATVTRLLNQASAGDTRAAASLLPLVYDQLRALARRRIRQERSGQTLEATALVHEAYIRPVDQSHDCHWAGVGIFSRRLRPCGVSWWRRCVGANA